MRAAIAVAAGLLALPVWANGSWRITLETPAEVVAIDLASVQRNQARASFRERRTLHGGQTDPNTMRPMREVLAKRVIDCRARRIATLSRAVFSDDDALIDHRAVRPGAEDWQPMAKDDPLLPLVCGRL